MSDKKKKLSKNMTELIYSVCLLAFFAFFLIMTSGVRVAEGMTTASVNARTFPYIFCGMGAIFSVVLIVRYVIRVVRERKEAKPAEPEEEQTSAQKVSELRALLSILLGVLFILLIYKLGVVVGGWLYLGAQIFLLLPPEKRTRKNYIIGAVVAFLVPIAIYVPFRYVFNVMLPMGIFKYWF